VVGSFSPSSSYGQRPRRLPLWNGGQFQYSRLRSSIGPPVGTVLRRDYKGRLLQVTVLSDGFEYEGQLYKSLSAVTKAITGAHWNGYHFFGLSKPCPFGKRA